MGREEEGERTSKERREKMSPEDAAPEGVMLHLIGVCEIGCRCTSSPDGRYEFYCSPPACSVQLSHGFSPVSDLVFLTVPHFSSMITMAALGHVFSTSFLS